MSVTLCWGAPRLGVHCALCVMAEVGCWWRPSRFWVQAFDFDHVWESRWVNSFENVPSCRTVNERAFCKTSCVVLDICHPFVKRRPSLVFRRRVTSGDSSPPPPPRTHIFMYCVYMYVVVHLCFGGQRNRERSLFSPFTTCVLGNKPCLVASAFIYQNTGPALSFILFFASRSCLHHEICI